MDNINDLIEKNNVEIFNICETLKFLNNKKEMLQKQNQEYENNKIKVSDHAIVQYFQRVLGYNIDEIKKEILSNNLEERYKENGDKVYDQGKFRVRVLNHTVVTTLEQKSYKY